MTDTEQKALALLNEVLAERVHWQMTGSRTDNASIEALCRAVEQHEATKQETAEREEQLVAAMQSGIARAEAQHEATKQELSDYKQKVSDVASVCAQHFSKTSWTVADRQRHVDLLSQFIIPKPKPDPLVEVAKTLGIYNTAAKHWAGDVRAALDALGYEIKEKNDD